MADKVDLSLTGQVDPSDKDYYVVKVSGLNLDNNYTAKFQWSFQEQSLNDQVKSIWSNGFTFLTRTESVPGMPSASVPLTSTGNIPVTLNAYPANALRVNVYVIGGEFGTGKVADYFLAAGTKTIAVTGGAYQVSLITVTQSNINGTPTNTFNIDVSQAGETIEAPTNPNGFTASRVLAGVQLNWAGTYSNSTFTGFEAIKVYAGTSATATNGTYVEVGVLTGNNVKNTITIPVDGTYVKYGQATYLHAAAVNKNGTVGTIQANVANVPLGPGKATDADINDGAVVIAKLASDVLTVGNLKAGDINATSYIRAGTKSANGLTGARVEISSAEITQTGTNVLAGLHIYNSAGTAILKAPLTGGLEIVGSGTFSGDISGANGTFAGNLSSSSGLFTVNNGILTAQSGTIGGWSINSTQLRSNFNYTSGNSASGVASYITLDPLTPGLVLTKDATISGGVPTGGSSMSINPVEGIVGPNVTVAGSTGPGFSFSPNGNAVLRGTIYANAGVFKGSVEGGSFSLSGYENTNKWTSGVFQAGGTSSYIQATSGGTVTMYSNPYQSEITEDGSTQGTSTFSYPTQIVVNGTSVNIHGLPGVGNGLTYINSLESGGSGAANPDITRYWSDNTAVNNTNFPYNYLGTRGTLVNQSLLPNAGATYNYGAAARYRMIVADPYDNNKLKRGLGVYYGSRTSAPGASTGFVGDLWVSW